MNLSLLRPELFQAGFHVTAIKLPEEVKNFVEKRDWPGLDETFKNLTSPEGKLYQFLQAFHEFSEIEFIISIRNSLNHWEEDGIWHDDGSRVMAFSLSLTLQEIQGGKLAIRKKGQDEVTWLSTPPFGEMIIFLTGLHGYEHKIHQVTQGERVIIAGWCS
jgi:hypothetical protein